MNPRLNRAPVLALAAAAALVGNLYALSGTDRKSVAPSE